MDKCSNKYVLSFLVLLKLLARTTFRVKEMEMVIFVENTILRIEDYRLKNIKTDQVDTVYVFLLVFF